MPLEDPSAEDRKSLLGVVERLRREYLEMTREFELVCQGPQGLTPIQVSMRLGIAKNSLARWRKHGRGPRFVKRNGRILYPPRELEAWLQVPGSG